MKKTLLVSLAILLTLIGVSLAASNDTGRFSDKYGILLDRSLFSRTRIVRPRTFATTNPTLRPAQSLVLTGVVLPGVGELRVRDNGPGIPDEIRGKIFEPFFTTKEVGEGTGLGLSICHRLVSEMEGRIRVESKPGEGSEFTLEFPRGV